MVRKNPQAGGDLRAGGNASQLGGYLMHMGKGSKPMARRE
jgi:hypothetical protein